MSASTLLHAVRVMDISKRSGADNDEKSRQLSFQFGGRQDSGCVSRAGLVGFPFDSFYVLVSLPSCE